MRALSKMYREVIAAQHKNAPTLTESKQKAGGTFPWQGRQKRQAVGDQNKACRQSREASRATYGRLAGNGLARSLAQLPRSSMDPLTSPLGNSLDYLSSYSTFTTQPTTYAPFLELRIIVKKSLSYHTINCWILSTARLIYWLTAEHSPKWLLARSSSPRL